MSEPAYERPTSIEEAIHLLASHDDAHPLSGGTDLTVAIRHGQRDPGLLVDVKGVEELAPSIEVSDGVIRIGANTVMTDLERNQTIKTEFPGLIEAAQVVGSVQIRNRATLAGNLGNASPAADTPPVLFALDATVVIQGPDGSRTMPADQFLVDYRTTALRRGELMTSILLPAPPVRSGSAFLKLGVRRAMEISIVCTAARLELSEDGTIASAGIGLGSVAPRTVRASAAERVLIGREPSEAVFAEAGAAAADSCDPIDDLRASAAYRRDMVPILVKRTLQRAWTRAKGSQ